LCSVIVDSSSAAGAGTHAPDAPPMMGPRRLPVPMTQGHLYLLKPAA
jgi:hypothetical protein